LTPAFWVCISVPSISNNTRRVTMLTSIVYLPLEAGQAGSRQRADSQLRTHHGKKKVRMQEKSSLFPKDFFRK
ncbi:MAG: hypothetical protein IKW70_08340, partial [Verrucomicrobia bacterium]|nr:hypothetical protein [Verrucomicrobiota bacterium]